MPVHNGLPHLDEAIESILVQTFDDFEFVIVDDASTDGSRERLRDWARRDGRIRLIELDDKLGPAMSSDRAAREAKTPIVARMDADDVSSPERLARQFAVLRDNPDCGLVASLCEIIDESGSLIRGPEPWRLARRSWLAPFAHGAIMYRRAVFDGLGGYRHECVYWEDQDLIARFAAASKILVIPQSLYQVRQTGTSTRAISDQRHLEGAMNLAYTSVDRLNCQTGYEDLLSGRSRDSKVDPRVFVALGSLTLWTGNRPRLFLRFLRRGKLRPDARTLAALGWTAWASLSPSSLRAFLQWRVAIKNRLAGSVSSNDPVAWPPSSVASHKQ